MSGPKRRQHPRYDAVLKVRFADSSEFLACYTDSISKGGIFVTARDPLPKGTRVQLTLELPATHETLELNGVVRYVVLPDSETAVRKPPGMGIRFERMDPRAADALEEYIHFLRNKSRGRILIVDDDEEYAGLLQRALRTRDYTVVCILNPQTALNTLEQDHFDLAITELTFPRMDGLEFADAVRSLPHGGNMGILMVTQAEVDSETQRVAERLRIGEILRKPVQLEEFLDVVVRVHEESRRQSNIQPGGVVPDEADGERYDPALESTLAKQRREAEIAGRFLGKLGVTTRYSDDRTQVFGEVLLQHIQLVVPFGASSPIPRIQVHSIQHDRIKIHEPDVLAVLEPISFLDLPDRAALERAILDTVQDHTEACHEHKKWLERMQIPALLDPERFACRGRVRIESQSVTFTVLAPGRVMVDDVAGRPLSKVPREDRILDVQSAESSLDVEMLLEPIARKAITALANSPRVSTESDGGDTRH